MDSTTFLTKTSLTDLEICTKDNVMLYVTKGWLAGTSDFFKNLLTEESHKSPMIQIGLRFESRILQIFHPSRSLFSKHHKRLVRPLLNLFNL